MQILLMDNTVKKDIDFQNVAWRKTALHYAAEMGHANCLKLLIEAGASLALHDYEFKTAHVLAKENEAEECANIIIQAMEKQGVSLETKIQCALKSPSLSEKFA